MSASYELQLQTKIFRRWCEEQIGQVEMTEYEKDNNSYEAPHDLMLLQGKRRVLEKLYATSLSEQPAECLELASKLVNEARENLEEHRAKKKVHNHFTLVHAKTLGEYSMLCDIERKLLSLE